MRWANHAVVVAFAAMSWWVGTVAGDSAARPDMGNATSGLPVIARISTRAQPTGDLPSSPVQGYRLLLQGSDGIRYFRTVADPRSESPLVRFVATGGIDAITVCARC